MMKSLIQYISICQSGAHWSRVSNCVRCILINSFYYRICGWRRRLTNQGVNQFTDAWMKFIGRDEAKCSANALSREPALLFVKQDAVAWISTQDSSENGIQCQYGAEHLQLIRSKSRVRWNRGDRRSMCSSDKPVESAHESGIAAEWVTRKSGKQSDLIDQQISSLALSRR